MKRSNKKGFTVVELVIVIAIIAILAAVLIPTFAGLIQKANESKDTQLVKNLNTALAADNKEHKTMTDALDAAVAFGYDVGKINTSATDNEILWDSVNDLFCYYNKSESKIQYIPNFEPAAGKTPATYQLWKIYDGKNGNTVPAYDSQTYSIYWAGEDAPSVTEVKVGFDAGNCKANMTLKYVGNGTAQNVVISTNGGTVLSVEGYVNESDNTKGDIVNHYGEAGSVDVIKCATASYHEYGKVGFIKVTNGRLSVESTGKVVTVFAAANTAKIDNNSGVIENAYVASGVTATGNQTLTALPSGQTEESIKEAALYQYNAAVKVGDAYFTNIREALSRVDEKFGEGYLMSGNMTIVLIKDIVDYGFKVASGSNITIDFNGHTYNIDGTVGSQGTTTNGCQLMKDSTVVMKNGTLTSSVAQLLIQNYSNLTLDNMVLDGRELSGWTPYTLSNNNGNITIKDTTIYAKSNGFAFDVCRYSSYKSVNVTVSGNSVINGKIEVFASGNDAKDGFSLTLESGDFSKASLIIDNTVADLINQNTVKQKNGLGISAPDGYEWTPDENGYQKLAKKN